MKKVFRDRVFFPKETVKKQLAVADKWLDYKITMANDPKKKYYISQIEVLNWDKNNPNYRWSSGKGYSFDECMASNFGELIERFSWGHWLDNFSNTKKTNLLNLNTGKYDTFYTKEIYDYKQSFDYIASGNTYVEAIYHALKEASEYAFIKHPYPFIPYDTYILKTENMFPEETFIHDNYTVILKKDKRTPLYNITVFKSPSEFDTVFMPESIYYNGSNVHINNVISHFSSSVHDKVDEEPWPAFEGERSGLNLSKVIDGAISEHVQSHYLLKMNGYIDHDIQYTKNIKKHNDLFEYRDAIDFPNNESETIEEDVEKIINSFNEYGYNVWALDITLPDSPIKAVKIITNYNIGTDNPCSRKILRNFYNF